VPNNSTPVKIRTTRTTSGVPRCEISGSFTGTQEHRVSMTEGSSQTAVLDLDTSPGEIAGNSGDTNLFREWDFRHVAVV
jgi:hypothetical protein